MARLALRRIERSLHRLARPGFVLPVVMFSLIITSVVAIAAFRTADDEREQALSFRDATRAQYAAESGLRYTLGAGWPTKSVSVMPTGGTLDLGYGAAGVTPPGQPGLRDHRVRLEPRARVHAVDHAMVARAIGQREPTQIQRASGRQV